MSTVNPAQLVEEFKKSGEFDRLRRELLSQFQNGDGIEAFNKRIADIVQQKFTSEEKLLLNPQDVVHRELLQEMDRYPVVERAVAEVRLLSDPDFHANIGESLRRTLQEIKGESSKNIATESEKGKANDSGETSDLSAGKVSPSLT